MSQMLKSSGAMAVATMTSRLLGMVREMVYAAFMGDTWVASAFMLAFQVPNLFRRLLGEGALTAPFLHESRANRETILMLQLLRLMFPYMVLVCLAAILIGMANARGHFFVPALGAVVLNLVMISSVLFLAPLYGR